MTMLSWNRGRGKRQPAQKKSTWIGCQRFDMPRLDMVALKEREALHQKYESHLDRVSTGSGSDLVSDRHAIFAKDFGL